MSARMIIVRGFTNSLGLIAVCMVSTQSKILRFNQNFAHITELHQSSHGSQGNRNPDICGV